MKFLFFGLLLSFSALASNDLAHRPRAFQAEHGKAVFVDFKEAIYNITYNIEKKEAKIRAYINFDAPEAGFPIFDSVTAPTSIFLNGKPVSAVESKTPENETTLRILKAEVAEGSHSLVIDLPLNELVEFDAGSVKSAFWTSDLSHRKFLESYMPASLEYDQVKMVFNVKFLGSTKKQLIYTNGVVEEMGNNNFSITYPEYFNASSIFFHTVPEGAVDEIRYTLKSINGRDVPVTIYVAKGPWGGNAATLELFREEANRVFDELEGDYGAWPHPELLIYNAGRGGMEYCGATMTGFGALGHELFHSYFARGMMPANGNSGWLDEALASWRDNGYQSRSSLSGSSMMSSHPYYTRVTDRVAYSFGESFMRFMNGKLMHKGGLKPFLRHIVENRMFAPLFVEEFIEEMETFYSVSVEADFKRYTYGSKNDFGPIHLGSPKGLKHTHPMHQEMSVKELKKYL